MKNLKLKFVLLSLSSAVLLSLGWLFPHCGGFALVGFVPLLWMDMLADRYGKRHFFWWYYLTFLLWNLATTWWVSIATVGGGIFAVVANSLFMSVVWALFRMVKRRMDGTLPYIFLVAAWIAWERFYFDAQVSWPWLTLGNAFAYSHTCVQWYEVLGTLGGSLWIWACNMAVFAVMRLLQEGRMRELNVKARVALASSVVLVFAGPLTASWVRYATYTPAGCASADVVIPCVVLQPNFDPYDKFESLDQRSQNTVALSLMSSALASRDSLAPCLVLAPETFTSDVCLNEISQGATVRSFKKAIEGRPNVNMLFGASSYEFFYQDEAPSFNARRTAGGTWYESHNSALMIDCGPRIEIYHKSRFVPGVESMPWPRVMRKVDDALGGVMGRCVGQDRVSLLNFVTYSDACRMSTKSVPLGCAICYESVYPEHFASYVAAGARAMTVITNDSWWGDTHGYRQHLRYSCLRAIETRRDIARCANTGISAFINQRGDIVSNTAWMERTSLEGELHLNDAVTPFVKYGDVVGRLASFVFLLILFAFGVKVITQPRPSRRVSSRSKSR